MKTQENPTQRTSYSLPDDWTDLDKYYLAYKVFTHAATHTNQPDDSETAKLAYTVFEGLRQLIISTPIKSQGDIETKLAILEHLVEFEHLDHKGNRDYSTMNPDETAALDICAQMRTHINASKCDNQRNAENAQKAQ